MKYIFKCFIHLAFVVFSFRASAQIEYPNFKNQNQIVPTDSQRLSLKISNLNYIYNTEYFTKIPLSGTLFGYQLIPELQYQPNSRFKISGGLYVQKEFGRKEYTSVFPVFSVKYKAKNSAFILGTLEGATNHGYIEPIYDYKLLINERLENGFQFFVDTKAYNHDFYINWRRAIHLGDAYKEEFDIGYIARVNLLNNETWEVSVPVQLLYSHKGGQIDTSNAPLTSIVNDAAGLSVGINMENSFLKKVVLDNYYVNYKDISGTKRQPFNEGNAYLAHLLLKFKFFDLDFRYWNGHGFINPRGNALFSSVSEKIPGYTEAYRELLLGSIIYDKEIFHNGHFNFRVSPYYDFGAKKLEYSYEMYFSYELNVMLAKIKNSVF